MALNMLVMSSVNKARVLCCGSGIKVESWACVAWQIKSSPPEIEIPSWPCGVRMSAKSGPYCVMRVAAVMRRSAVPIPMGRILSRLLGSL